MKKIWRLYQLLIFNICVCFPTLSASAVFPSDATGNCSRISLKRIIATIFQDHLCQAILVLQKKKKLSEECLVFWDFPIDIYYKMCVTRFVLVLRRKDKKISLRGMCYPILHTLLINFKIRGISLLFYAFVSTRIWVRKNVAKFWRRERSLYVCSVWRADKTHGNTIGSTPVKHLKRGKKKKWR